MPGSKEVIERRDRVDLHEEHAWAHRVACLRAAGTKASPTEAGLNP